MAETETKPAETGVARGKRRTRVGVVVSDKADKTIKAVAVFTARHAKYGKYFRRRTTMHAHDEQNDAKVGDRVELMECRPMSRTKRWRLVRVIDRLGSRG